MIECNLHLPEASVLWDDGTQGYTVDADVLALLDELNLNEDV